MRIDHHGVRSRRPLALDRPEHRRRALAGAAGAASDDQNRRRDVDHKALAPLSLNPLPERTACSLVCSGDACAFIHRGSQQRAVRNLGSCAILRALPRAPARSAAPRSRETATGIRLRHFLHHTPASNASPLPPNFRHQQAGKPLGKRFQRSREIPLHPCCRAGCADAPPSPCR